MTALSKAGFEEIRTRGSHHFLRHPDGRCTVVPLHSGETIGPGLMVKILRETEMTAKQFISLRSESSRTQELLRSHQ